MDAELLQIIGKPTVNQICTVGTVTYFDDSLKGQYGFAKTDQGTVFFHGERGFRLADNGTDLPGLGVLDRTVEGLLTNPPKRRDKILCIAQPAKKGLQAARWVVISDDVMQTVLEEIMNRKTYEVVSCKGSNLEFGSAKTLWKGTDLDLLKKKYPKSKYPLSDTFYILVNGEKHEVR